MTAVNRSTAVWLYVKH